MTPEATNTFANLSDQDGDYHKTMGCEKYKQIIEPRLIWHFDRMKEFMIVDPDEPERNESISSPCPNPIEETSNENNLPTTNDLELTATGRPTRTPKRISRYSHESTPKS